MNTERITKEQVLIVVLALLLAVSLGWIIVRQTGGVFKSEPQYQTYCDQSGFRLFFASGAFTAVADDHCKLSINQQSGGGVR